ncbi:citrate/2-methylcitrate synthase [Streptomyces sp. NPDC098781]|uniref:citrate/2-methylcitrate synthase n=1 Tax=Streptomyces sp. NPDC098781 TaxID=3366097 RepID=UPI0037F9696D
MRARARPIRSGRSPYSSRTWAIQSAVRDTAQSALPAMAGKAGMFTPTFAAARVVGWSANIREQAQDSNIVMPVARCVGPGAPVRVAQAEA